MPRLSPSLLLRWLPALLLLLLAAPAPAQELRTQKTPFSVWLDLQTLKADAPPKTTLPAWLRSVQKDTTVGVAKAVLKTTFRLHFRHFDELNRDLLVRFIYDDVKEDTVSVTGWTETGVQKFARGPYGSGLNLPASETVIIAMEGVDYIDLEARGDGANVRGVFLSWLRTAETRHALDFPHPDEVADPFDNPPSQLPPLDDWYLAGRVRATIDPGLVKLTPRLKTDEVWEFELSAAPFVAVIAFEILNADPLAPLEVIVNDHSLGPCAIHAPDLADPGYQGVVRPVDRGVQFRYAGWLKAQKAVPGSALRAGVNRVMLRLAAGSGPVAVRAVELQLKNQWQTFDQTLIPANP